MLTKRQRRTAAHKFRVVLKAFDGSKTIDQALTYRTHIEDNFTPRWRQAAR